MLFFSTVRSRVFSSTVLLVVVRPFLPRLWLPSVRPTLLVSRDLNCLPCGSVNQSRMYDLLFASRTCRFAMSLIRLVQRLLVSSSLMNWTPLLVAEVALLVTVVRVTVS